MVTTVVLCHGNWTKGNSTTMTSEPEANQEQIMQRLHTERRSAFQKIGLLFTDGKNHGHHSDKRPRGEAEFLGHKAKSELVKGEKSRLGRQASGAPLEPETA